METPAWTRPGLCIHQPLGPRVRSWRSLKSPGRGWGGAASVPGPHIELRAEVGLDAKPGLSSEAATVPMTPLERGHRLPQVKDGEAWQQPAVWLVRPGLPAGSSSWARGFGTGTWAQCLLRHPPHLPLPPGVGPLGPLLPGQTRSPLRLPPPQDPIRASTEPRSLCN